MANIKKAAEKGFEVVVMSQEQIFKPMSITINITSKEALKSLQEAIQEIQSEICYALDSGNVEKYPFNAFIKAVDNL